MTSNKKPPFNPSAPIFGKMPNLEITDDLLRETEPADAFVSKFMGQAENFSHAKATFSKVCVDGKGRPFFESEAEFLRKLDDALFHFENFRELVQADSSGDLNDQRKYFERLQKAIAPLNEVLADLKDNHSKRLAHAGFVLPQMLTEEGLKNDFIQKSKDLQAAVSKVRGELKGRNSGRHAELYLLIEQLADMHERWPKLTHNDHNSNNHGTFFDLIKSIYPLVNLSSAESITDHTIVEGIKFARKR